MQKKSKENPIVAKSYIFALRVIKAHKVLFEERKERVLSMQFLRSGTSIGANIREAVQAQSKKDFISKMSISLKEAHETDYWTQLLRDSDYFRMNESESLLKDLSELIAILTSILKTSRS